VPSTRVSEDQIKRLLAAADRPSRHKGLVLMEQQYQRPVAEGIRRRFPELPADDLADAWREAVRGLVQKVMTGRFSPDGSLPGLLYTIAHHWIVSNARRAGVRREALEGVLEPIARALQGTEVGRQWKGLDPVERNEFMALLAESIRWLPPRQQQVMRVFVSHFPESLNMEVLRREVSAVSGEEETLAAVKRALQEARRKARELLRRGAYDAGKRGDA
jgi:DNA-directed RNA polymerase specialized sigma24 family protein